MAAQSKNRGFFPNKNSKKVEYKLLSSKELIVIYNYLEEQFGIPEAELNKYEFIKRGLDLWACTKKSLQVIQFEGIGLKLSTIGLRAMRNPFEGNKKITTNFAQAFGMYATKNTYELKEDELLPYLRGQDLELESDIGRGHRIIKYNNNIVGVGHAQETKIINQIPKSRFIKNWNIKSV